ncbi:hypothetical protein [uncultured Methylovirgula sp.]|uniref:hypothetical protein n=1 Tax=uncultured Methylovirgula sp. TaxID=1285960 RepID=UPI00261F7581|nr:hypothetical protein [uncultured Methylovirgula sp.]
MRGKIKVWAKPALILGTLGLLGLGLAPARADEAACHGLASAMVKNSKTPYHSVGSISFDPKDPPAGDAKMTAKPIATETIFTGDKVFVKLPSGQWKDIHAAIAELQQRVESSAQSLTDCQQLADDTIDGKKFAVYTGADKTDTINVATKIWVSADTGTLARTETTIAGPTAPDGKIRHQFISLRYDYADIKAPSVSN